MLRAPAGYRRT